MAETKKAIFIKPLRKDYSQTTNYVVTKQPYNYCRKTFNWFRTTHKTDIVKKVQSSFKVSTLFATKSQAAQIESYIGWRLNITLMVKE